MNQLENGPAGQNAVRHVSITQTMWESGNDSEAATTPTRSPSVTEATQSRSRATSYTVQV